LEVTWNKPRNSFSENHYVLYACGIKLRSLRNCTKNTSKKKRILVRYWESWLRWLLICIPEMLGSNIPMTLTMLIEVFHVFSHSLQVS
jgi:hypothetical protein